MLQSAHEQYVEQQKITASAILTARRKAGNSSKAVAASIVAHQIESAALTFNSVPEQLAEQGLDAPPVAVASLSSIATSTAAATSFVEKAGKFGLDRLVGALVADAGRTAATIDMGRRPKLSGYIRSLVLPSCGRCAVLAGRVYRYSTGFQRHPLCDCLMTPTTQDIGRDLVLDSSEAVSSGQIRGLSQADMVALDSGADLGQVVNVRRKQSGLVIGSSVVARAGRLTPQGCLFLGSDRADAIRLMAQNGYITTP